MILVTFNSEKLAGLAINCENLEVFVVLMVMTLQEQTQRP